jgi:hypothetical protein
MQDLGNLYISRLRRRINISCLTAIIGIPCLVGLFWFIFNVLVPSLEGRHISSSPFMLTLLFSGLIVFCVAVPLVISYFVINRRARKLDDVFIPLGFAGSTYMFDGRQYQMNNNGRQINVYFYRGPTLEIRITIPVNANFQVFQQSSIQVSVAHNLHKDAWRSDDPQLEPLAFYPADSQWLPAFLKDPSAVDAVQQLMNRGADWAIFRRLELLPGELLLNLYQSKEWNSYPLDQGDVKNWIQQLDILADELLAADLPIVDESLAATRAQSRNGIEKLVTTSILAIFFGMPLCVIIVFIITFLAVGNG